MARNPLFRATALERLSSPEQLDQRLQIVPPRAWLAFAALAVLLLAAAAWSVLARLPVHVAGEGVFQPAAAGAPREIVVFIAADDVRRVRAGLSARIHPPRAGTVIGSVREVANETASRGELLRAFDNEAFVARLTRLGPVARVSVTLPAATAFPAGMHCGVDIAIGETRPAALIFGR